MTNELENMENMENVDVENLEIVEMSDEELDNVVGGALAIGTRVRLPLNYGQIRYCPNCGNLINARTGTISRFRGVNSRGENVYFVKMDCCGYNYPGGCENSMQVINN